MNPIRWISALLALNTMCGPVSLAAAERSATAPPSVDPAEAVVVDGAAIGRCLSLEERLAVEEEDCAQATYSELAAGRIDVEEAIARLERCASARPAFQEGLRRREQRGADLARARAASARIRIVTRTEYDARVAEELDGLEAARLRFLESAGTSNRLIGSVRSFARAVGGVGRGDDLARAAARRASADREALRERLGNLRLELGLDPVLYEMARARVELAIDQDRVCREAAVERRRWMRVGTGGLVGLVLAAGAVIATGTTGTLVGGIIIAVALEATAAAYLIALTERGPPVSLAQSGESAAADSSRAEQALEADPSDPGEAPEEWERRRPESDFSVARGGDRGEGGEGGGEPSGGAWATRVPAVLPASLPEEEILLPRMLDPVEMHDLRSLTFAEIQSRLDEFLVSRTPAPEPVEGRDGRIEDEAFLRSLVEEAKSALELWRDERALPPSFGEFFVRAELEEVAAGVRAGALARAAARFAADQADYRGSGDLEDLRRRMARRLVTHCRAGSVPGDLVLAACTDEMALTVLLLAAVLESGVDLPEGSVLGVQFIGDRVHPVLFFERAGEVESLIRGTRVRGVGGPIYRPAVLYYTFLLEHGEQPEIDPAEHLRLAAPDARLEAPEPVCAPPERGLLGRVLDRLRALLGMEAPSRAGGDCGELVSAASEEVAARDGESAERAESGEASEEEAAQPLAGVARSPARSPEDPAEPRAEDAGERTESDDATRPDGEAAEEAPEAAAEGESAVSDTGAEEERYPEALRAPAGEEGEEIEGRESILDLAEVARMTVEMTEASEDAGRLEIAPWLVAADSGFNVPTARVLYADNEGALAWFEDGDRFITLSPSEVEEQRRMLEAESYPLFPATTTCASSGIPPRRVFRRAGADGEAARFVFCDQSESLVIFETRNDARSYGGLSAPDRPVFLARLATDRLAELEGAEEMRMLHRFLEDPEVLLTWSGGEVERLDRTVSTLITFQHTLESALVQSMEELEEPELRGHYYDLHRQVLQAPLFADFAEAVYRLNRRLASDPLRSLAWANALPEDDRRAFFRLYHRLGLTMSWAEQWELLARRYSGEPAPASRPAPGAASPDFLQILGDPTRVRVDWSEGARGNLASIRDREPRPGERRSEDPPAADPAEDGGDEVGRRGSRGRGSAGRGRGMGPERGTRPLQMIRIRTAPDGNGPKVAPHNPIRPGGTRGEATPKGAPATRQEPVLRVAPATFVEALLSTWDTSELDPGSAGRVPPILRFSPPLRRYFLETLGDGEAYERRLLLAMEAFTAGGWLRYEEVRRAMGGEAVAVHAVVTGSSRYNAEFSRNAPINDRAQIRAPNFFSSTPVILPADLYEAVRENYLRAHTGYFDLAADPAPAEALRLEWVPLGPGSAGEAERARLLRALGIVAEQAAERPAPR